MYATTEVKRGLPGSTQTAGALIERIEQDVQACRDAGLDSERALDLIPKWSALVKQEPKRFIRDDGTIDIDVLINFRRLQVFISDSPSWDTRQFNLRRLLSGGRRGAVKSLRECLAVLKEHGYDHLLRRYPCSPVGNPHVFECQGYFYTFRWFKHIYLLGLMNRALRERLPAGFIGIDIGSSYGIFSSLVRQEYPGSRHVLVDFPEQLLLAHYFLGASFPEARIASLADVLPQESLTRDFFSAFDFVLVPTARFERLREGSVDLVTNFASFGEMSHKWFDHYLQSPAFRSAKYFFTANRIQSYPTYDTDLTILDYPIWDAAKRLHFGVSPAFSGYYHYPRKYWLFCERTASPPYFEYIGTI